MLRYFLKDVRTADRLMFFLVIGSILLGLALNYFIHPLSQQNLAVLQAEAWLNGKLWLDQYYFDTALWQGHAYVTYPPFPSLLVLPLLAFAHSSAISTLALSIPLAGLSLYKLYQLAGLQDTEPGKRILLALALLGGTAFAFVFRISNSVYGYTQLCGFTFTLLALHETKNRQRGWLCGLYLAAAFLSRQMIILAVPCFLYHYYKRYRAEKKMAALWQLLLMIGGGLLIYLLFNYLRFGHMLESGYRFLQLPPHLQQKVAAHGVFSLQHLPGNAWYLFLQPPSLIHQAGSGWQPHPYGTALSWASPFLLAAFLQKKWDPAKVLLLLSSIIIAAAQLTYYTNGYVQVNCQRFSLEYMPFLFMLLFSSEHRHKAWFRAALVYSVLLNLLFLSFWHG